MKKEAFGISDGSAGMVAQLRSFAEAMDYSLSELTVGVNLPWHYLPNCCFDLGGGRIFPIISADTMKLFEELPEIIISCGRKAALVSAYLRNLSDKNYQQSTKFIHIQDPQMSARNFDVVIAMEHDRIKGSNVIKTPYALHNITEEKLQEARNLWFERFANLPRPWNAVLIGGSTNKYDFTTKAMRELILQLEKISGSLLITISRRTGGANSCLLAQHSWRGEVFIYEGKGDNPYLGMLACADKIYVTNDSVNMMSEALASGKKVEILKLSGHSGTKPARFAENLHKIGKDPKIMMQEIAGSVSNILAGSS